MQKFTVHVYAVVRVAIPNIEAETMAAAIHEAREVVDHAYLGQALGNLPHEAHYAEADNGYVVDVAGDADHSQSSTFCADGITPVHETQADGNLISRCPQCARPE